MIIYHNIPKAWHSYLKSHFAVSIMISIEALVRVLVKNGIVTQAEILEEIKQVKLEQESKRN